MKSYHDQKTEPEVLAAIEDFQKDGGRFSKFIKHLAKCLAGVCFLPLLLLFYCPLI
jgi:hypothetical protein